MSQSDVYGVLVVDKPPGVTSRRVVDAVSRTLSTKAVGHAGTLDPLARGVVVVCVGYARKLVEEIVATAKNDRGLENRGIEVLGRTQCRLGLALAFQVIAITLARIERTQMQQPAHS